MCLRPGLVLVLVTIGLPPVATGQYGPTSGFPDNRPGGYGRSPIRPGAVPTNVPGGYGRSPVKPDATREDLGGDYSDPFRGRPRIDRYGRPYPEESEVVDYQPVYEYQKFCTGCQQRVADSATIGQRCPHCGVLWVSDRTNPSATLGSSGGGSSASTGQPLLNLSARQSGQLLKLVLAIGALIVTGIVYVVRRASWSPTQIAAAGRAAVYSPWELEEARLARSGPVAAIVRVASPAQASQAQAGPPPDPDSSETTGHSVSELRRRLRPSS